MKIRLKKLKRIVFQVFKIKIDIMLMTNLDSAINAVTDGRNVLVNANNIKSESMVITAVAHELVHIIYNYNDGTMSFSRALSDIEGKLLERIDE